MNWFLNLATRNKLFLGFGLLIIFLAIVVVTAYQNIIGMQESQRTLYERHFANAVDLMALRMNENGVRTALLTMMVMPKRSEQEAWHQDLKERSREMELLMRNLLERNRSAPQLFRRLEELNATRNAFKETRDTQVIPLIYEGKIEEAKKLILGLQHERFEKMRALTAELGEDAKEQAQAAVTQSNQRVKETLRLFGIVGAGALLMSVVMTLFLNRIIASPLRELAAAADRIASRDLTVTVPSDGRVDEVGSLAHTFREMVENLREMNREIREGVTVLGSSAGEILAATAQVASGAVETATAVSETTTTVEEVKQTAQVSSQKAKYVSDSAQKAAHVSQAGKKAIEETIEGIGRIREQMESIAASIVRLSEQSQAIGGIIATVNDLSEQSNLLAVNAAIEAAKAGEQGKGFAVVAQEVKSLAEQSKQATAQVRTILNDIQKATSAAVMATEQGSKAVAAGVKQSADAGEAIRMLAESIAEAAQAATQIAASSQQQLAGVDQVALAMDNIKQASTQNVAGTKQTETAAHGLHEVGQKLKQMVERYKV